MATNLIEITDDDFIDKQDFVKIQCDKYYASRFDSIISVTVENWNAFGTHENGTSIKCEDVLQSELRWVSAMRPWQVWGFWV